MKQILLIFLTTCLVVACTNNQQDGPVTKEQIRPVGSAGPARIPPQNTLTNALMQDYWVFEHHVLTNDPEGTNFNKGRWYKFHPDGTYDGGHWQDQTDFGNWYYKLTPEKTFILIDSEVNDLNDAEWDVQQSTRDYTAMSWVRTGNYGDQRVVLGKLVKLTTMPTRQSFGLE